ncbi:hypothetical protein A2U01_0113253, partial [Trifolium medium]|nr:hypothetical protein [Trifolium medium]
MSTRAGIMVFPRDFSRSFVGRDIIIVP